MTMECGLVLVAGSSLQMFSVVLYCIVMLRFTSATAFLFVFLQVCLLVSLPGLEKHVFLRKSF